MQVVMSEVADELRKTSQQENGERRLTPRLEGRGAAKSTSKSASRTPMRQNSSGSYSKLEGTDWRRLVNLPFASWQLWLNELVRQGTLAPGEDVTICGSVVQRRIRCLRPKVLVLTDAPRLILLDSKGLNLVQTLDLSSCALQVQSSVAFALKAANSR